LPEVIADDWLAIVDWHKFQRDHALHQPLTGYIVLKLLGFGCSNQAFKINKTNLLDLFVETILQWKGTRYLREYLENTHMMDHGDNSLWFGNKNGSKELWKALLVETAYLASLFHDMGYPWQYVNILKDKLEYSSGPLYETPSECENEIIRLYGNRLFFCPMNGYHLLDRNTPSTWESNLKVIVGQALRKTHGFPGAIGFLYLNDILRDFPNTKKHPIRQFCVEWAALGVMMHDMGKVYWGKDKTKTPPDNPHLQLRFEIDPLGCLIALADVLEEFERPIVAFSPNQAGTHGSYGTACYSTELTYDQGKLSILYKMASASERILKMHYMAEEQKEYFDPLHGYVNLSYCGINCVTMDAIFDPNIKKS
jgi:hypothetical protein